MDSKNFFIFVFYRELSRFELLRKVEWIQMFLFTFSGIFVKILLILLKFVKIFKNSVADFIFKDKK